MFDRQYINSLFARDEVAFTRFYRDTRSYFIGTISKIFPDLNVSKVNLYQDSMITLLDNIIDGVIVETGFKTIQALRSYLVSIGIRKCYEKRREFQKLMRYKQSPDESPDLQEEGLPQPPPLRIPKEEKFNFKQMRDEELEELLGYAQGKSGKSSLDLREEAKEMLDKTINETLVSIQRINQKGMFYGSSEYIETLRDWREFLKNKYPIFDDFNDIGFPCNRLLRYTWYDKMNDKEILEAFEGYFSNTNSIKTKRFKCHKSLKKLFDDWRENH